jgi:murein L,D-transpeptidase YcbB/YkuD
MERWRWLPDTVPSRAIVVNVPAFRLYAFERDGSLATPVVRMNVVVGEAESGNGTPLFTGTMREVVFQPYWDVPPSIARTEMLPKIRRDTGYLEREQLEIVRGGDHDAVVFPPTPENLRRVAEGTLRIRQRPGPLNSLGPVKFLFPNRYNVYLHGTPAPELFARSRRDFSHGCIRLEDPAALARWALDGQAGWDSSAVATAMTTGRQSRRVRLARPVQVYMLYATAVAEDDGSVRFHSDIYGHDATLLRALGWRAE